MLTPISNSRRPNVATKRLSVLKCAPCPSRRIRRVLTTNTILCPAAVPKITRRRWSTTSRSKTPRTPAFSRHSTISTTTSWKHCRKWSYARRRRSNASARDRSSSPATRYNAVPTDSSHLLLRVTRLRKLRVIVSRRSGLCPRAWCTVHQCRQTPLWWRATTFSRVQTGSSPSAATNS